jgi:hypothetical protein
LRLLVEAKAQFDTFFSSAEQKVISNSLLMRAHGLSSSLEVYSAFKNVGYSQGSLTI